MGLNKENKNIGYLLGRLYAVIEATSKKANNTNSSIDRYWEKLYDTPKIVYSMLISKHKINLSRLNNKNVLLAEEYETLTNEIIDLIVDIPDVFGVDPIGIAQKAYIPLGYYHQKAKLYNQ